jgi:hypothetical protein
MPSLRRLYLLIPLGVMLGPLAGCTYSSDYVPPQDGRARAVWARDKVVASLPAAEERCIDETLAVAAGRPEHVRVVGTRTVVRGGPSIVIWAPLPAGHVYTSSGPRVHHVDAVRTVATPTPRPPPGGPVGRPAGGGPRSSPQVPHGSGGSSGGADAAAIAAAAAVVVIVAMPAITLGLALSSPGDPKASAAATDRVSAYNDLARTQGSPCAPSAAYEEVTEP